MKTVLTIVLIQFFSIVTAHAQTVHLSVAASMTDAFKEIISVFATQHPKAELLPNFASSGSLAKQIEQGAPADFYVSANPKWMKYLVEKKIITPESSHIFAYNKLVFVGDKNLAVSSLKSLLGLQRIALGSPGSVPAGQYAKQAMEKVGIYAELAEKKKLIMAKDVRQALMYADRGEVDGAFVYTTDAMLAGNAKILFTVPQDLYDQVAYPMGLTRSGADNTMAKAFYQYMGTPEAKQILTKYGFEPAH
ncbi:molybdate ABC transporter substrate-binding protein [Desulfogranum marinum]|uniref:molybdate ABC transporter substrate-binding protein n=1 Tax=Desulfogranum marinum TaxID=453220 RepID=UPI0029C6AC36|nr:molybdate ABC transporter substrate-binding protein [Desulfogranum marinum]